MRLSLTGSSSTGKTTLSNALMSNSRFREYIDEFVSVDGRRLLEQAHCQSIDNMSREQLGQFQIQYFKNKIAVEEKRFNYLTDRSFVDIAAYWLVRDTYDKPIEDKEKLLLPCKEFARRYDYTFYLPTGVIPFERDGYRSENMEFNNNIDKVIISLLERWNIKYYKITSSKIEERVDELLQVLTKLT